MEDSHVTSNKNFNEINFAVKYAKHHQKMTERFGNEYTEKLISRGFQNGRIIDVGCGAGGTLIALAKRFPDSEIVGIDLSEPLLNIAKENAEAANVDNQLRFEKADVQSIPYSDNHFDVVINLNMVHLVQEPITLLNEMERILAPSGFIFIADLRRSWLGLFEKEINVTLTLEEAKQLFQKSKLRNGVFSSSLLWWRFEN